MKIPDRRRLIAGAAVLALGLALGMGFGQIRLHGQAKAYEAKLKEISRHLAQAQRKYTQGLAAQNSLEDEKAAALAEVERLAKEKERLAAEGGALKSRIDSLSALTSSLQEKLGRAEAKTASEESKNGQLQARLTKTEAERGALEQKQAQTFRTLQEREKELKSLVQNYDRCVDNNVRLYYVGDELIRKYRERSVVKTLLQKEPFTQVKKVQLEKLVEEYKERIDREKLKSK